jgi:hypothetical protein
VKSVPPDTKLRLLNHLSRAEVEVRVAAQFECCQATPAHQSVRAALARIGEARHWLSQNLTAELPATNPLLSPRQHHRAVQRRMAKLAP